MIELGQISYKFRWQQVDNTEHVTSTTRFTDLDDLQKDIKRMNEVWRGTNTHWIVRYEAQTLKTGKTGWVEVEEVFA